MGDCQNYGPFLGPYYSTGSNRGPNLGDPKRDHNFDSSPYNERWLFFGWWGVLLKKRRRGRLCGFLGPLGNRSVQGFRV